MENKLTFGQALSKIAKAPPVKTSKKDKPSVTDKKQGKGVKTDKEE